ncbi:hypothetical protein T10_3815, partial [Trichinella papuae]
LTCVVVVRYSSFSFDTALLYLILFATFGLIFYVFKFENLFPKLTFQSWRLRTWTSTYHRIVECFDLDDREHVPKGRISPKRKCSFQFLSTRCN